MLKYSQLIIFIFEALSKRFLRDVLGDFQFVEKTAYKLFYTHIQDAVVKKKDSTTESMENAKI